MFSNLRLTHKGLILVLIPLAFEAFFLWMIFNSLAQAEAAAHEEAKSRALIDEAYTVTIMIYDAGRSLMDCWFEGDYSKLPSFGGHGAQLEEKYKTLWKLTSGNSRSRAHVEKIQQLSRQMMAMFGSEIVPTISYGETAGASDVQYFEKRSNSFYAPLLKEVKLLIQDEKKHLERIHRKREKEASGAKSTIIVCLCLSIVITFLMLQFFSASVTARLATINSNLARFAGRKQLLPPLDGTDEIANVDQEFRRMSDQVLAAEASKQEFLNMISHDMRTPLSALQGTLSVASMGAYGELTEYGAERMVKAEANVGRLIALINDLLDIERIESGSLQLDMADEEIWDLVSNAVDTVTPVAEQKGVKLINKCDEVFVKCDGRRVEQVLINLIANAVKFSPDDSEVTISSSEDIKNIRVSVTDRGRGISPDQQEKIFQRFKQVEAADATEKKGYGLGLAIVKSLVELHHGEVGVKSQVGEGSTFWFSIPKSNTSA